MLKKSLSAFILLAICSSPLLATAQHEDQRNDNQQYDHHDNQHYVHHTEWRHGYHMNHDDWNRGERVDYRTHHLRRPPNGYEWREVDGNYVEAAVATGIVASVIAASH